MVLLHIMKQWYLNHHIKRTKRIWFNDSHCVCVRLFLYIVDSFKFWERANYITKCAILCREWERVKQIKFAKKEKKYSKSVQNLFQCNKTRRKELEIMSNRINDKEKHIDIKQNRFSAKMRWRKCNLWKVTVIIECCYCSNYTNDCQMVLNWNECCRSIDIMNVKAIAKVRNMFWAKTKNRTKKFETFYLSSSTTLFI